MLSFKGLKDFDVETSDGKIASIEDIYFDDEQFAVRYLVVNTGAWLFGKKVLVSPYMVERVHLGKKTVELNIDQNRLKHCLEQEENKPLSRQMEKSYYDKFYLPYYWGGPGLWGMYGTPYGRTSEDQGYHEYLEREFPNEEYLDFEHTNPISEAELHKNNHLRSAGEIKSYHVDAKDGRVGHIEDYIIDDEDWSIRYFVVDTGEWLLGRQVLVAPDWLSSIEWTNKTAYFHVEREEIRKAPIYDGLAPVNKVYEAKLYDYYGQPKYWGGEQLRRTTTDNMGIPRDENKGIF